MKRGPVYLIFIYRLHLFFLYLLHLHHLQVRSRGLHTKHLGCCLVAARALHQAGEQEEALALLEEAEPLIKEEEVREGSRCLEERWVSSVYLVKGRILDSLDSRLQAAEAFQVHLLGLNNPSTSSKDSLSFLPRFFLRC